MTTLNELPVQTTNKSMQLRLRLQNPFFTPVLII